jgi:hypothetical protein
MDSFVNRRCPCRRACGHHFDVLHNLGDARLGEIESNHIVWQQPTHQCEYSRRNDYNTAGSDVHGGIYSVHPAIWEVFSSGFFRPGGKPFFHHPQKITDSNCR